MDDSRRQFLQQLGLLTAAIATWRCTPPAAPAPDAGVAPPPGILPPPGSGLAPPLRPDQLDALRACCERVLPTDAEPGAKEAGVARFCGEQLRRPELADIRRRIEGGLLALERRAQRQGKKRFAELAVEEQDQLLAETQRGSGQGEQFLRILISIVLEGFLSDPFYGGNVGRVGWQFIGYAPCAIEEGSVPRDGGHLHGVGARHE